MAGLAREAFGWADGCLGLIEARGPGAPSLLHYEPHSWIHSARANARALLGDLGGAIADSDRGLELAGDDYSRLLAHFTRSSLDRWRGEVAGALQHGRRAHDLARKLGGPANLNLAGACLGLALGELVKWPEARPFLEESRNARQKVEFFTMFPGLALALFHCGDPERALAVAREDAALGARTGAAFCELEFQIELAEVAARCGYESEARTALARARELVEQTECRLLAPSIHEAAAVLAETLGDTGQRVFELRAAHRLYSDLGATGHAARIASALETHGG
jgi:tetratricopeptide (TPR) repeat protein